MIHTINLEKVGLRRTNPLTLQRQLAFIIDRALAGGRGTKQGWALVKPIPAEIEPKPNPNNTAWIYTLVIELQKNGKEVTQDVELRQIASIKEVITKSGKMGNWRISGEASATKVTDEFPEELATLKIERSTHFDHLYGLDDQINITLCALQTAIDTNFKKRFHVCLYGDPGCGKSDIIHGLKEMLGPEGYIEFDGTQTTRAGAIKVIMESAVIPPLLMIEEIEKVPDHEILWLLSALDGRQEIRKITNNGVRQRSVPFLCLTTVNDMKLFRDRRQGAMASRFPHQLYCPRPTEEILRRILSREIDSIGGKHEWIEPALRYCLEVEKTNDPRRIIAVCLTGRDHLIGGNFQQAMKACTKDETE